MYGTRAYTHTLDSWGKGEDASGARWLASFADGPQIAHLQCNMSHLWRPRSILRVAIGDNVQAENGEQHVNDL